MRVLLIGGSGFIGPFVVAELARAGHELAILHRGRTAMPPHRSIVGDRTRLAASRDAIRDFAPEIVIDLVLSSERQARELAEVMRGITRRIVALSSMDVYRACGVTHGFEPGPLEPLPLTEESALRTKLQTYPPKQIAMLQQVFGWLDNEYDKIPVERVLLDDAELATTVLRLPMVYGPGDPLRRLHWLVKRIDDARRAIIVPLPAWSATRGYVEDVGAAIALAATSDAAIGRIYNVGEPEAPTELAWAQHVARVAGWDGELVQLPDDAIPAHLRIPGNAAQHWVADTSRIRRELGFAERVSRDEAIRRTIAWERATPATAGVLPHRFDYAAEDAALAQPR
jgi:nucleoside-diphosphate-sugar epimerase